MKSGGSRHGRVERRDELFGRVQLGQRRPLVRRRAPRRGRVPATSCSRRSSRRTMPSSVSGKPVESSGSITPAADGSSAHVGPATARAAERQPRRVDERQRRRAPSGTDRATDGSVASSRSHAARALGGAERRRDRIGQRGAGAGDAVVETQHPDPAAGKHVMHARHRRPDTAAAPAAAAAGPSARRLRSACRVPASAAASGAALPRGRARGAGIRAARWRR